MTHVLLDIRLSSYREIHSRLRRWGMTLGTFDIQSADPDWPASHQCDLALLDSNTASALGKIRRPANLLMNPEQQAPIILLGVSGPLLLDRDAWQGLNQNNPDSRTLRQAMQVALEKSYRRNNHSEENEDQGDFLTFLGHEMRTPLTAVKTALEVLEGDLGGMGIKTAEDDPQLKMVALALKNVRRLQHTIEWSQEMLASSGGQSKAELGLLSCEKLESFLQEKFELKEADFPAETQVMTDLTALDDLVVQCSRALDYTFADRGVESRVHFEGEPEKGTGWLHVDLLPVSLPSNVTVPRISRFGLESLNNQAQGSGCELQKLTGFVVSGGLKEYLGVELEIFQDSEGQSGIRISLVLQARPVQNKESVVRLLPTA
ncbi:MAG: hypothetical protein GY780_08510 [bacterium]|nr:hypothetical protein [bacterium]